MKRPVQKWLLFVATGTLPQLRGFSNSNPYPHTDSNPNRHAEGHANYRLHYCWKRRGLQQRRAGQPQRELSGCILVTEQHTFHQQRSRGQQMARDSSSIVREQWSDTNSHATPTAASKVTATSTAPTTAFPQANRDSNSHAQTNAGDFTERIILRYCMGTERKPRRRCRQSWQTLQAACKRTTSEVGWELPPSPRYSRTLEP